MNKPITFLIKIQEVSYLSKNSRKNYFKNMKNSKNPWKTRCLKMTKRWKKN